jgi:hypothetical protein
VRKARGGARGARSGEKAEAGAHSRRLSGRLPGGGCRSARAGDDGGRGAGSGGGRRYHAIRGAPAREVGLEGKADGVGDLRERLLGKWRR